MKFLYEKVKIGWRISGYFSMLFLIAFFGGIILVVTRNVFYFILMVFILFGFTELMIRWSYNNYRYELTKDAVKIERGVITRVYKSIPYGRIQNVDIRRGILARILGYSVVMIHTAGYSGPAQNALVEGRLPGVSIEEAEKIREYIIKKSQK